jgi:hypothetical protein
MSSLDETRKFPSIVNLSGFKIDKPAGALRQIND